MKKYFSFFIILLLITSMTSLNAQTGDFSPKFFGYVKSFHQSDLTDGQGQFSVVHARLGVRGNLNENVSYRIFTDYARLLGASVVGTDSDGDGELNSARLNLRSILLDAFFNMKLTDRLSFSIGQYKIPFSTSNLRSPVEMEFVNRPLTTSVTPALRDVGLTVYYKNKEVLPVDAALGVFNGSGENVNENNKTMNYSARVVASPINEIKISGNYYGGKINNADVNIFDIGVHAKFNNILFDVEFVSRKNDIPNVLEFTSTGYFVYTGYIFATDFWVLNSITPLVRYESFDPSTNINDDQLTRFTAGINFGLADKNFTGIRLNYENRDSKNPIFNSNDYFYASFQVVF